MGFKCGIVGLPNVGKSTLFNALTSTASAAAANYPFCTIEPNVGQVPVPDPRLHQLAKIADSLLNQKPINRYEIRPTPSQPKYSCIKLLDITNINMAKVNREI